VPVIDLKHININCIKPISTILSHNYYKFNNDCYQQEDGLAMGAPSSAVLPEIYLQFIECNNIYDILPKHNIIGYFRYADDVLVNIHR
jgi:hypothetical protein